jgi:DNA-binding MarR family transcriptional regulator
MELEKELEVLEYIYRTKEGVRQRDLAEIAGVSLGMINVILKRLAVRGWIKIKKINNRNIHYLVSSAGLEAISHRSYSFFKRTVKNLVYYKDILEKLILEIKHKGFTEVVLVGRSEVDFLVEHFCVKYGVGYQTLLSDAITAADSIPRTVSLSDKTDIGSYYLYGEDICRAADNQNNRREYEIYLREVLIG